MAGKRKQQKERGDPSFRRVEQAADAAVDEILAEDLILRRLGVRPDSQR